MLPPSIADAKTVDVQAIGLGVGVLSLNGHRRTLDRGVAGLSAWARLAPWACRGLPYSEFISRVCLRLFSVTVTGAAHFGLVVATSYSALVNVCASDFFLLTSAANLSIRSARLYGFAIVMSVMTTTLVT